MQKHLSNFFRISCTKDYSNRLISHRVIQGIIGWLFGPLCTLMFVVSEHWPMELLTEYVQLLFCFLHFNEKDADQQSMAQTWRQLKKFILID